MNVTMIFLISFCSNTHMIFLLRPFHLRFSNKLLLQFSLVWCIYRFVPFLYQQNKVYLFKCPFRGFLEDSVRFKLLLSCCIWNIWKSHGLSAVFWNIMVLKYTTTRKPCIPTIYGFLHQFLSTIQFYLDLILCFVKDNHIFLSLIASAAHSFILLHLLESSWWFFLYSTIPPSNFSWMHSALI